MPGVDLQIVSEWGMCGFPNMFPRKQAQVGLGWETESWKWAVEEMEGNDADTQDRGVPRQTPLGMHLYVSEPLVFQESVQGA